MINVLCFIAGGVLGALLMGIVIASGNYNEREEQRNDDSN